MISIIDKKTTGEMLSVHGDRKRIIGRSAEFRDIFSRMKIGESFVYPAEGTHEKRKISCLIKGTCHHLKAKIKTRTVNEGILVVFEGYK